MTLDVEISLVNTDNRELLRRCVATLPAACEGLDWHATVVDNASTDGSAEMVETEFPWAAVIRNERRLGFSANHNQVVRPAVEQRTANYVLVLNEDTELDPGSVTELVRCCDADATCGAAGPVVVGPDGRRQPTYQAFPTVWSELRATLLPGRRSPVEKRSSGWLNGACVLARTEALREVGALDERFFIFYEDTDLGLRLLRRGWSSGVCEGSRIIHLEHQTVAQARVGSTMDRQMIRSRYLYVSKHFGPVEAALLSVAIRGALAVRSAKALVESLVTGDREERRLAGHLWSLARYDPKAALGHELHARASSP